jgi:hypothetical protein
MIVAFVLIQSKCSRIFPLLIALQDFVNDEIYEECAPLATFESAIRVVEYEFRERVVDNMEFDFLKRTQSKDDVTEGVGESVELRFSHIAAD